MTPKQFEEQLAITRGNLMAAFKNGPTTDFDTYTKLVIDHHEHMTRALFNELYALQTEINTMKSDILKDIRERHQLLMKEINEKKK